MHESSSPNSRTPESSSLLDSSSSSKLKLSLCFFMAGGGEYQETLGTGRLRSRRFSLVSVTWSKSVSSEGSVDFVGGGSPNSCVQ